MFKLLIVILLSMLLSSSVMTTDHPSSNMVTETALSHPLASAPEDSSVRLYAVSPSQGLFHSAVLEIGQQRRTFQWSGSADISTAPQLFYRDVNEDGIREAVVILTRARERVWNCRSCILLTYRQWRNMPLNQRKMLYPSEYTAPWSYVTTTARYISLL